MLERSRFTAKMSSRENVFLNAKFAETTEKRGTESRRLALVATRVRDDEEGRTVGSRNGLRGSKVELLLGGAFGAWCEVESGGWIFGF